MQREADISQQHMNAILRTHLIDAEALRPDDFDSFFRKREAELLHRIEESMDKPIARDSIELTAPEPTEYEVEAQIA
jgi:hypothetical protein